MLNGSNPFPPEFETPDPKPLEPFDPIANPGDYCFALAYGYSRDNPPPTHPRPPLAGRLRQPLKI